MPCPYEERILPISFGVSPCEICILSGSRKIACPPRRVIPASKELRVRVDEKKKSMNRVLSASSRVGRSSPHFILRSEASCSTVSSSSLLHSCVLMKSRPRKLVFMKSCPFSVNVSCYIQRRVIEKFGDWHSQIFETRRSPWSSGPVILLIGYNPRAGLTSQSPADGFGHGDESGAAPAFQVVDDGLHLWSHAAFREMPFFIVLLRLAQGDAFEVALVGLSIIERDFLYSG